MTDTGLTTTTGSALAETRYTSEQWEIVRTNFFPRDASESEVLMCRERARRSGLDVLKGQAYFWRDPVSGKIVMVASVHGMRAIAMQRGAQIQSAAVYENDDFLCDPIAGTVKHTFRATGRGPCVGAWARGRLPGGEILVRWIAISEYRRAKGVWVEKPATMCEKTAIAQLCRALVPDALSDLYGAEEFGGQSNDEDGGFSVAMPTEAPEDPDAKRIASHLEALELATTAEELDAAAEKARKAKLAEKWPTAAQRLYKSKLEARRVALTPPTATSTTSAEPTGDREPGEDEG